mgnify:CR=1 FL=1
MYHIPKLFTIGIQWEKNKTMIEISNIPNLPLMPSEIASFFYEDYLNNGIELRNDTKHFIK